MKKDLKLQSLQERRFIARNVLFHKALRNESKIETRLNTSTTDYISHLYTRTDSYKFSFLPRTIRCWNIIPMEIRREGTSETFREKLSSAVEKGYLMLTQPRGTFNRPNLGKRIKKDQNYVY